MRFIRTDRRSCMHVRACVVFAPGGRNAPDRDDLISPDRSGGCVTSRSVFFVPRPSRIRLSRQGDGRADITRSIQSYRPRWWMQSCNARPLQSILHYGPDRGNKRSLWHSSFTLNTSQRVKQIHKYAHDARPTLPKPRINQHPWHLRVPAGSR